MPTFEEKVQILKNLDTKELIQRLNRFEDELETTLWEEASLKNLNSGYLAGYGSDCSEVERLLAELSLKAPEIVPGGDKKMTVQDRTAWLTLQRTQNEPLVAAINRQNNITFQVENLRVKAEIAKKRLEGTKAVLGLKTAQIEFLSGEG